MTKERMGEIALMYLCKKVRRESISLDPTQMRRQLGVTAKELDISIGEAAAFMENMLFGAVNELLEDLRKIKQ